MQSLHRFHGSEWLASARNLPKLQEQDIRLFRISLGHWQCSLGGNCDVVFVLEWEIGIIGGKFPAKCLDNFSRMIVYQQDSVSGQEIEKLAMV